MEEADEQGDTGENAGRVAYGCVACRELVCEGGFDAEGIGAVGPDELDPGVGFEVGDGPCEVGNVDVVELVCAVGYALALRCDTRRCHICS
jgi:hypothetical protein